MGEAEGAAQSQRGCCVTLASNCSFLSLFPLLCNGRGWGVGGALRAMNQLLGILSPVECPFTYRHLRRLGHTGHSGPQSLPPSPSPGPSFPATVWLPRQGPTVTVPRKLRLQDSSGQFSRWVGLPQLADLPAVGPGGESLRMQALSPQTCLPTWNTCLQLSSSPLEPPHRNPHSPPAVPSPALGCTGFCIALGWPTCDGRPVSARCAILEFYPGEKRPDSKFLEGITSMIWIWL